MRFKSVKTGDIYSYDTGYAKGRYVVTAKSDYGAGIIFNDGCAQFETPKDWNEFFSKDKLISRNSTVTVSVK